MSRGNKHVNRGLSNGLAHNEGGLACTERLYSAGILGVNHVSVLTSMLLLRNNRSDIAYLSHLSLYALMVLMVGSDGH